MVSPSFFQFKDTFAFLIILSVIMMSYSVSFHSLNHQKSEFVWAEIERVMQHGFWMLLEQKQEYECGFYDRLLSLSLSYVYFLICILASKLSSFKLRRQPSYMYILFAIFLNKVILCCSTTVFKNWI